MSQLSVDEFLSEIDWGAVAKRLVAYTLRRMHRFAPSLANEALAMEIVHEAIVHLIDDNYRDWVPKDGPTLQGLMLHLGSEINGIVINQHRKAMRRPKSVPLPKLVGSAAPKVDAMQESEVELTVWIEQAQTILRGNDNALALLGLFVEGCTKATEQAKALGWSTRKVYRVREEVRTKLGKLRS